MTSVRQLTLGGYSRLSTTTLVRRGNEVIGAWVPVGELDRLEATTTDPVDLLPTGSARAGDGDGGTSAAVPVDLADGTLAVVQGGKAVPVPSRRKPVDLTRRA